MAVIRVEHKKHKDMRDILKRYESREAIKVGFPSKVGSVKYPTGQRVTDVATYNEFGTTTIPSRPFMKLSVKPATESMRFIFRHAAEKLNRQLTTKKRVCEIAGVAIQDDFKRTITNLTEPPNSPSTIAKKKSSNPLVDSALMRGTLTYEVFKDDK